MVARVEAYLNARRKLGFQLRIEGGELLRFARYADSSGHRGALTTDLALRWAQEAKSATALYRARRLEVVGCFAKHQAAFDPDTEVPPKGLLGPAHRRTQPYIFTQAEITKLMRAALQLPPRHGLRGQTYEVLIGLLACTGLRISEALQLRRADVDLVAGVLSIRLTKFRKSRLVPIHASTQAQLRRYLDRRDAVASPSAGTALFACKAGRALPYTTVRTTLRKLIDEVIPPDTYRSRRPRIHDLRHTFACRCLLRWYQEGVNVDQRMPALSTYLGHAKVSDTYWYLTGVPELMAIAAARFERFGRARAQ